jgi:hypothetical protein
VQPVQFPSFIKAGAVRVIWFLLSPSTVFHLKAAGCDSLQPFVFAHRSASFAPHLNSSCVSLPKHLMWTAAFAPRHPLRCAKDFIKPSKSGRLDFCVSSRCNDNRPGPLPDRGSWTAIRRGGSASGQHLPHAVPGYRMPRALLRPGALLLHSASAGHTI